MKTQLDDDDYLAIQLLRYSRPTETTERFFFSEMSTVQATTLLSPDKRIVAIDIYAYDHDHNYFDENPWKEFKSIGDFNDYFLAEPKCDLIDCNIELEGGLKIGSHDDGEVSIEFPSDSSYNSIINSIFEKYSLDKKIIDIIKDRPGHYIAIDERSNIIGDYESFDDYLKHSASN